MTKWASLALAVAAVFGAGCAAPKDPGDDTSTTTPTATTAPCFSGQPGVTYTLPPGTVLCETTDPSETTSPPPTTTPTTAAPTEPLHFHVSSFAFDPSSATMAAGTEVRWHGHASGHTTTVHKEGTPTGQYEYDASLASGAENVHVFSAPGTYHVFCKPHSSGATGDYSSGMVSTITVT